MNRTHLALVLPLLAIATLAAACLHSISATPETINGRPAVEVCAELMAKATPSGTPRAVATVAPSAAPAIPRVE